MSVRLRFPLLVAVGLALAPAARAETQRERFDAGGYFRVATRPDFAGGDSRLGYWNLYGRLLNEGPWAALEMRLDLLQQQSRSNQPWTSLHAKVEGGSVANVDPNGGRLENFMLTQLYVKAGNVAIPGVTWQLGTLDSYFGDLGLYDMKPAQIFFDTVGLSARYERPRFDLMLGAGDAGYFVRRDEYSTIFTGGGALRVRVVPGHFELGGGGQLWHAPEVVGNRFAPHHTPMADWDYEDYARGEIAESYNEANPNPGQADLFPKPVPTSSSAWKAVGYAGFGNVGPIRWNNFFANYLTRLPENFYTDTDDRPAGTADFVVYETRLTDERVELNLGNEMQLTVIAGRLDAIWGVLYGNHTDGDNDIQPSDHDRTFLSTVLRLQLYLSDTVHLLGETAIAEEWSRNGNRYREHKDSVRFNTGGTPDADGLEWGDTDTRNTWQGKGGIVLNPAGMGVFNRPSLRILYGIQYSNQNNAFGNSFTEELDDYDDFEPVERHWHHVLGVEAEAWF